MTTEENTSEIAELKQLILSTSNLKDQALVYYQSGVLSLPEYQERVKELSDYLDNDLIPRWNELVS